MAKSGIKAVLWTMVCPGLGEYRLGHRVLGGLIAVTFIAVCGWLVAGTYSSVNDISEYVKSRDATLELPPASTSEMLTALGRLFAAIHAEYLVRRAAIHHRLSIPLWILFLIYSYSLVQSYVLGVRKDRAAAS